MRISLIEDTLLKKDRQVDGVGLTAKAPAVGIYFDRNLDATRPRWQVPGMQYRERERAGVSRAENN
jgi:hypothetical protein